MSVDTLLARLEHVRATGKGRWRAKCPAHGGENRYALAIREDAGTVLIHCFVCEGGAGAVAEALGMDLAEFFPPRQPGVHSGKGVARPWRVAETTQALIKDVRVMYVLAGMVARGKPLVAADVAFAAGAQKRIGRLIGELDRSV